MRRLGDILELKDADRALAQAWPSAAPASIAVALEHRLAQAAEADLVLAPQRVAGSAKPERENAAAPARAADRPLHRLPLYHCAITRSASRCPPAHSSPSTRHSRLPSFYAAKVRAIRPARG